MKKFFALLLLFLISNFCYAQDWEQIIPGSWIDTPVEVSKNIKKISVKKMNEYYSSLSPSNEIIYSKMAAYCNTQASESKKECLEYVKNSEDIAKNTYYSIVSYEVFCDEKKLCTHFAKDYSKDGKLLKETGMDSSDLDEDIKATLSKIRCSNVKSGSFGERLFKYACKK